MEVMKGRMKNCYLQSLVKSERCYGEGEQRILKIATDSMGFIELLHPFEAVLLDYLQFGVWNSFP